MLMLRVVLGAALGYAVVVLLAKLLQERLAFPAPRAPVPDPRRLGIAYGERVELVSGDGTKLVGWYLGPTTRNDGGGRGKAGKVSNTSPDLPHPSPSFPALLWFYGNGENIAGIAPVLRDFQPPGTALLVVDYPGYGGSGGRATEAALYAAADAAYRALASRPGVDPRRIAVYGRSLGSAVATYTAAHHPVARLILESPFTSAAAMARHLYGFLPRFALRLSLDNVATIRRVHCPVLLLHGTDDRLVPTAMGMEVATAAQGPVEVVLIHGAGHNDTYAVGGRAYRDKVWDFMTGRGTRDGGEGHTARPLSPVPRP
jgi:pimeloyl-ACP methyl ester carboxylesterase